MHLHVKLFQVFNTNIGQSSAELLMIQPAIIPISFSTGKFVPPSFQSWGSNLNQVSGEDQPFIPALTADMLFHVETVATSVENPGRHTFHPCKIQGRGGQNM